MVNIREGNWIIKIQNDEELFKIQKIATGIDIRDYGRKTTHHIRIKNGKWEGWTDDLSWYQQQTEYENYNYINASDLITEPQYHPITPKVGEKYRVVKTVSTDHPYISQGNTFVVSKIDESSIPVCDENDYWYANSYLTTEYLELVEEPKFGAYGCTVAKYDDAPSFEPMTINSENINLIMNQAIEKLQKQSHSMYQTEPINKSIIQKSMSFIKRLTQSSDDKALLKARFTDDCGNLTSRGQEALTSLVFAEKKADLVKLAEEVIAEEKE